MSTSQLIAEQHKDTELVSLLRESWTKMKSQNLACLFTKNGVLMRKWGPPDVSIKDEWAVKYHIVVPKSYKQYILSMAHETSHLATWETTRPVRRFLTISTGPV